MKNVNNVFQYDFQDKTKTKQVKYNSFTFMHFRPIAKSYTTKIIFSNQPVSAFLFTKTNQFFQITLVQNKYFHPKPANKYFKIFYYS